MSRKVLLSAPLVLLALTLAAGQEIALWCQPSLRGIVSEDQQRLLFLPVDHLTTTP